MMNKTIKLLLSFIAAISVLESAVYAQEAGNHNIVNVLPPSPTASEIGRVGLASTHLSSGEINTSIPLYTYRTPNLQIPITLNYSSGGLKVNQVATRVGLGWSYNIGGVISRTVLGKPDDLSQHLRVPSDFPATNVADGTGFINNAISGNYDIQPDLFTFNFSGGSGSFFIDEMNQIVKLEQNNLNILNNNYSSFTIQTPDGVIYTFADVEKSTYTNNCSGIYYKHDAPINNAWYLTEVRHPDGDTVWIKYGNCDFIYQSSKDQTYSGFDFFGSTNLISSSDCSKPIPFSECDYYTHNFAVYPIQIASNSRGVVRLKYTRRTDLVQPTNSATTGDVRLNSIEVIDTTVDRLTVLEDYKQCNVIKLFSLNYWEGLGSENNLFLTDITESRNSSSEIIRNYSLNYNQLELVPPRISFSQDYLGYFNGKANSTLIKKPLDLKWVNEFQSYGFANRNPDWRYSRVGTLSKITYPTGGSDSITYEPNTIHDEEMYLDPDRNLSFDQEGGNQLKQAVTKYSPSINIYQNNSAQLNVYCKLNSSMSQDVTIGDSSDYYLTVDIIDNNNSSILPSPYYVGLNQQLIVEVPLKRENSYRLKITYFSQVADLASLGYYGGPRVTERELPGVRVKKIISSDNLGHSYAKRFYYSNFLDTLHSNALVASTSIDNKIIYENRIARPHNYNVCDYYVCSYVRFGSNCFYDMISGAQVLYPVVLESSEEGFRNGVIEHKFFCGFEASGDQIQGPSIVNGPRCNTSIFGYSGFEYETNFYKKGPSGFTLQKKTTKTFHINDSTKNDYPFFVIAASGSGAEQGCVTSSNALQNFVNVSCLRYYFYSRWIFPDHTETRIYDQDGILSAVTKEDNEFNNALHKQISRQTTTYSNSNIVVNEYKYLQEILNGPPDFYNQVGATQDNWNGLWNLRSKNIFAAPVITTTYKNSTLLQQDVNFYKISSANGTAHLNNIFSKLRSYPFEKKLEVLSYNTAGKILEQRKAGDVLHSYIWNYKNLYPVAEATNANSGEIAYTSFEGEEKGYWTYQETGIVSNVSITGTKAFNLSGDVFITKSGLSSQKKYIVSYWSRGGSVSVNGTQGKNLLSRGGWTLFIHEISFATDVSLTGNGQIIDELRLYPTGAMMSTYTYQPLVGISAECNSNNRIFFYEYDELQRLKLIRDDDRNIVKTFNYKLNVHPNELANWVRTGAIRCKPCSLNPSFNTNIQQHQEKDMGSQSPTFNSIEWVDDGPSSSCSVSAVWQNTVDAVYCKKTSLQNNTGELVQLQRDINPCSATYQATREFVVATNTATCPLQTCNIGEKLINGDCVAGTRVNTSSSYHLQNGGYWTCTFHFEWNDGTISANYEENTIEDCMLL